MKPSKLLLWLQRKRGTVGKKAGRASKKHDSTPSITPDWLKIGLVVFTIAALSVLMSVHLLPDKISLRLGEISAREVRAGRSVYYINTEKTAQAQQVARITARPVYDVDESAVFNANRIVLELFDRIARERATLPHYTAKSESLQKTIDALQAQFGSNFSRAQLRSLLTISPALLDKYRATTTRLVSEEMDREIRDQADLYLASDDLNRARAEVKRTARAALSSEEAAGLVGAVARQALRPNRLLNRRRTEEAKEDAARRIGIVREPIVRGERIIGPGDRVKQEHLDKFIALGLLNPHMETTTGVAVCVLAASMVLLVVYLIKRTLPTLYQDRKRLALLSVIVLLSVFGLKVGATMLGLQFSSGQLGYLGMMSVAAAGMLVSVLLDMHLAVLVVALLSVQSGLIMNHEIRFTIMTLMSSLVGIACVGNVRRKNNIPGTTAALAGANLLMVLLLGLLLSEDAQEILTGSAWAVASAAFATFLYWFGVLALEKPFGILTHTALLELSASDRPLLKQLCALAPGTYAHSMMVGTLAEAGAQAIGADALLCRVGGYYHDIGKMQHPEFFVENQRHENVHCRLSASLSALIITAHVRDGVQMAKEHRLPSEIRDVIAQHHGTTLIRYFYHQALTDCGGSDEAPPGLEERFRYPGPKPQTREAAVVMLADSIEAAARTLDKPSPERLEALITNIVRDKIEDGQLNECSLTFQDVKYVSDAFLRFLTAMMHSRIDYPELEPRTATGQPMEVSRPDLRLEPMQLPLSEAESEMIAHSPALLDLEKVGGLEAESAYEMVAHLGEVPPSSPSLMEPEVFYGRLPVERPPASGTDERSTPGSASPAPGRRPGPR
jgi:putative nucleotidyltransferase with HDIG domain